ncbi:MAG: sugar-binding protein [Victivallales bacterium]
MPNTFYRSLMAAALSAACISPLCAKELTKYECVKSSNPIAVDGSLLDWADAVPVYCDKDEQKNLPLFTGANDLAVKAYLMWDDTYLYFAVDVDDDKYCQNETKSSVWLGDSVQCIFDVPETEKIPFSEYEIAMTKKGPSIYAASGAPVEDIKLAISKKEGSEGFTYEMAIPWKTLKINPAEGKELGFTFLVNDNDGNGREGWIEWTPGIAVSKDPSTFARITLVPGKKGKDPVRGQMTFKKSYYEMGDKIDYAAYLQSDLAISGKLRIDVLKDGGIVKSNSSDVALSQGINKFSNDLDVTGLDSGAYGIRAYMPANGADVLFASSNITLVDVEKTKAYIRTLKDKCTALGKIIDEGKAKKIDMSYALMHKTVGDVFSTYAEKDLGEKLYEDVEINTAYLNQMLDKALESGASFLKNPDMDMYVPDCDVKSLKIKNGSFYTKNNEPVMLVGAVGWWEAKDFSTAADIGFNVINSEIGPSAILHDEARMDMGGVDNVRRQMDLCRKNNLAYNLLLSIHYFPGWACKRYPEILTRGSTPEKVNTPPEGNNFMPVRLDDKNARGIYEKYLTTLIPAVKSPDTLVSYCLANESIYYDYNDYNDKALKQFKLYLEDKYKTIDTLNGAWSTKYPDFGSAAVLPQYIIVTPKKSEITQAQWHEWLSFNQYRVTGFFTWMQGIIKANDGNTFTHLKVPSAGGGRNGVEGEQISDLCDISGLDCGCEYPDKEYAFDFMAGMMIYDFYRSVNPGKPVFDSEMHFTGRSYAPEKYFYAQILLSYLHGVDANGIWVWNRKLKMYRSILTEPMRMKSMGKAALDLRRLAKYVDAFQNNKAPIAILWSQSSILSLNADEHTDALKGVYQNIYFLNTPTDFITEKRILDSKLKDYRILVIPSAFYVNDSVYDRIADFAKNGGLVVVSGDDSLRFNEYGKERDLSSFYNIATVKRVAKVEDCRDAVKGNLGKINIDREIALGMKTSSGYDTGDMDGIEYRSIKNDAKTICYVINLKKEKAAFTLMKKDGKPVMKSKDLISGKHLGDEIILESMDVLMLEVVVK